LSLMSLVLLELVLVFFFMFLVVLFSSSDGNIDGVSVAIVQTYYAPYPFRSARRASSLILINLINPITLITLIILIT
jgi:hypothetical protein